MKYYLPVLGNDNIIHCVEVGDSSTTACEGKCSVKQVNPDFGKLQSVGIPILWCYECSHILEEQKEKQNENYKI